MPSFPTHHSSVSISSTFFFFPSFQTLSDGVVVVVVVSLLFSRFSRFDLIFSVAPFFSPSHRFRKSKSFEAFRTLKSSCPYNLFPMDGCGWNCRVMYLLFPFFFSLFSYRIYRSIGADTTHDDDVLKNRFVIMKRAIMATMERLRVQRGSLNFELMQTMMMMVLFTYVRDR